MVSKHSLHRVECFITVHDLSLAKHAALGLKTVYNIVQTFCLHKNLQYNLFVLTCQIVSGQCLITRYYFSGLQHHASLFLILNIAIAMCLSQVNAF